MIEKMEQVLSIINDRSKGWFALRPELVAILGIDSCHDLLNEFESQLGSFPGKKLPHYSLIFYLALVILHPHDELAGRASDAKQKKVIV